MPISLDITNSILTSINNALQNVDLTEQQRSVLINQYEQITHMIRSGYQFSDSDLLSLPDAIRSETLILLNSEIASYSVSVQNLINAIQTAINAISSRASFGSSSVGRINLPILFSASGISHSHTHLKTNIRSNIIAMHRFKFSGYSHAGSDNLFDCSVGFYMHPNGILGKSSVSTIGFSLDAYASEDGYIVLVVGHPLFSLFHTTIDSFSVHGLIPLPLLITDYMFATSSSVQY